MPKDSPIIPENWMWLVEIAIALAIILTFSLILRKGVGILRKYAGKKKGGWRRKIDKIIHMPLQIAIWGFGIAYIIDVASTHFGLEVVAKTVRPLKGGFIVACVSWAILRWIKEAFIQLAKKSERLGVSSSTIYALSKLTTFVVLILALMIILQVMGLNVGPLLAVGGIGLAGVSFAAKDIIANFFGGAMIHLTRSFSIGDEIVIPSKDNFEGEVREIGWYMTMVEDYYRRPVYLPNALFSTVHVINESRRTHRRIKETIAIRYEDQPNLEKIINEIREKIGAHPDVDNSQSFSITFSKLGEYGLEIYSYILVYKVGYIRFLAIKQELFLIMGEVVQKYGAEFCYPTTTVLLEQAGPKGPTK